MTGAEPALRRETGRVLILGSVVLAVLAAAALALGSDDARLLRLGIVAALWATLLGTFAAVRMRREVSSGAERADELRVVYQLELDREIAARREHELTVERELREQVEQRERNEIVALRGELAALRDTLRNLLGGDVLVERVALRAESTRLLPVPDHPWTSAEGHGRRPAANTVPRIAAGLTAAESEPSIFAQTAAELVRNVGVPTNRNVGVPTNRTWSPAVPSVQPRRAAFEQDRPGGPANREMPGPEDGEMPGPVNREMAQGGRHSRPSAPRYGSTPPSAHEANSHGRHDRRPVNELLASYGQGATPRRRHSRADD